MKRGPTPEKPQLLPSSVIGKPIWHAECHILDVHLRPVPPGLIGELCIAGAPVTRGYQNDTALTAAKFVRDPFSSDHGARLYRTGDLAHYMPDGNIRFVGRRDQQVKVRGVRIEPRAIEAVLNADPAITESLVRAVEDSEGEKRLVAWVAVSPEETAASQRDLTSRLHALVGERLPRFMTPESFVLLEKLPRTSRGKLDLRALPLPDFGRSRMPQTVVAPNNDVEKAVARIWKEVLRVDRVGVHDHFLKIGGDSISATRIVSRVNRVFGAALPLRVIFDAPTIASLAARLSETPRHDAPKAGTHHDRVP
jgi:hypothetical protein